MSATIIREAIVDHLKTVSGIGIIHRYERAVVDGQKFTSLFTKDGRLLGWTITRTGVTETVLDTQTNQIAHRWRIRGWMGLEDAKASELEFDHLIERVRAAFRKDDTLGGVIESTRNGEEIGLQLRDVGPFTLAGVICHGATLELTTVEAACLNTGVVDDFITGGVTWRPGGEDQVKPNILLGGPVGGAPPSRA